MNRLQKVFLVLVVVSSFDGVTTFFNLMLGGSELNPMFAVLNGDSWFPHLLLIGSVKPVLCMFLFLLFSLVGRKLEKDSSPAWFLCVWGKLDFVGALLVVEQVFIVGYNLFGVVSGVI